jgi:hypothetical protein
MQRDVRLGFEAPRVSGVVPMQPDGGVSAVLPRLSGPGP